jgi:hypothetical protein
MHAMIFELRAAEAAALLPPDSEGSLARWRGPIAATLRRALEALAQMLRRLEKGIDKQN